jgi:rod shape determining protein RodA
MEGPMLGVDRRSFQNFDWLLFGIVSLLLAIGLANLYSATQAGAEVGLPTELKRQLTALGAGLVLMIAVVCLDYRHLERLAIPLYVGTLALLVVTLVFAEVTRGTRGWLEWGPLRIQTAELAKIGLILALARYFHRHPPNETKRLRDLIQPVLITAAPVGLIVLQPDLGVAVLTMLVAVTFLPLVRIPTRAWVGMLAAGVVALACLWQFALSDYQRSRILDVVDPGRDPLASGYQAIQSRIAVGSGGFLGKGYLEGTQTQLSFLPRSSPSSPPSTRTSRSRCSPRSGASWAARSCSGSTSSCCCGGSSSPGAPGTASVRSWRWAWSGSSSGQRSSTSPWCWGSPR